MRLIFSSGDRMMLRLTILFLIIFLLLSSAEGQMTPPVSKRYPGLARTSDTISAPQVFILSLDHASCKGVIFIPQPGQFDRASLEKAPYPSSPPPVSRPHVPFLQVHGNVLYN